MVLQRFVDYGENLSGKILVVTLGAFSSVLLFEIMQTN
jgi:hypothetical protein